MGERLVLASTSRYRAELLRRLDVAFSQRDPELDEDAALSALGERNPAELALCLARAKAESAAARSGRSADEWVLASDQLGWLDAEDGRPRLLRKARDRADAVDQLMAMSGRRHHLATAVVLRPPTALLEAGAETREHLDLHRLEMRRFTRPEAEAYVRRHDPLDCAGSYRIEDAGIGLFERIEGGDFTGIIGLPLIAVARMLRETGLSAPAEA